MTVRIPGELDPASQAEIVGQSQRAIEADVVGYPVAATVLSAMRSCAMAMTVHPLTLSVEDPTPTITVIRVAGDLNRASAPRLARLADSCLNRCAETGRSHVVVDLACVRTFGRGGLHVLRHAQQAGEQAGVVVHLTGLADRAGLLPSWVPDIVARFDSFPTVEGAVSVLARIERDDQGPAPRGDATTHDAKPDDRTSSSS